MQPILKPIIRNAYILFFILLEGIALFITVRSKTYHQFVVNDIAVNVSGFVNQEISGVTEFVSLKENNEILSEENLRLKEELLSIQEQIALLDTVSKFKVDTLYHQKFEFVSAKVVSNTIIKSHNFITINRGEKHGIEKGMGVISPLGVVGFVYNTTKNYSRLVSALNTDVRISARVKENDYFGTLIWDGKDARYMYLKEIPKYVGVKVGNHVETDGNSSSLPEGIQIGIIEEVGVDELSGELEIKVKLNEDFAKLRHVQVVINNERQEVEEVEQTDSAENDK